MKEETTETTLLCYRLKSKQEVLDVIEKYKHTDIVLVLETKIEKLYFSHNMMQDCIINVLTVDELLNGEIDHMKFDHTIGNPPYQKQVGPDKTEQIWPGLVLKFKALLKKGGDYNMVHPGNWKTSQKKVFLAVKEMYLTHIITEMEFNDYKKGLKTFGVNTDYDVVSMINTPPIAGVKTTVVIDGKKTNILLTDYSTIPSKNIDIYDMLKAKDSEEKIEMLYSRSAYGHDKPNVKKTKDNEYKYPVVYGNPISGTTFIYSNTNKNGQYGIKKLILVGASKSGILDLEGSFAMSEYSHAIVDTSENLIKIKKVFEDSTFQELISSFVGRSDKAVLVPNVSNARFIKEFRKDFWKEFYTEAMEQELIKEGKING